MNAPVPTIARLDLTRVEEVMHTGVVTCDSTAPLAAVAQILAEARIHCVVVSGLEQTRDGERLTWGTVSDRDLIGALAASRGDAIAGEIAATEFVTVEPAETVARAAQLMAEHDVSHLVVVERDFPIGVISSLDVARAASDR
jgi:signal-transduction protein with cAMP-binding, CBS, and nucleotidyltransferase domain